MLLQLISSVFLLGSANASSLGEAARACFDPLKIENEKVQSQWLGEGCATGALFSWIGPEPVLQVVMDNGKGVPRVFRFALPPGELKPEAVLTLAAPDFVANCGHAVNLKIKSVQPLKMTLAESEGKTLKSEATNTAQAVELMAKDIVKVLRSATAQNPQAFRNRDLAICHARLTAILTNYKLSAEMNPDDLEYLELGFHPRRGVEPARASSAARPEG